MTVVSQQLPRLNPFSSYFFFLDSRFEYRTRINECRFKKLFDNSLFVNRCSLFIIQFCVYKYIDVCRLKLQPLPNNFRGSIPSVHTSFSSTPGLNIDLLFSSLFRILFFSGLIMTKEEKKPSQNKEYHDV